MEAQASDQTFTKGFNDGYLISVYEQQVADYMIESMQTDNDYLFGFKSGIEEGDRERLEIERMDELVSSREESLENDQQRTSETDLER